MTLYWVGGAATWNSSAGTKWSLTSGGVGGLAVPTAADDVVFDANSGAVTVTTSGASTDLARSIDFTGFTGTFSHASSTTVTIGDGTAGAGNIALKTVAGMTYTVGSTSSSLINFVSTSATQQTITTGGITLPSYTINGVGSSYLLSDANTSSGTVTLSIGTFNTNGQTCSWGLFNSNFGTARTLTLGASAITITGVGTSWLTSSVVGLTVTSNTATVTLSGVNSSFSTGGINFNGLSVVMTGSGISSFGFNSTFANFTRTSTATKTDSLTLTGSTTLTGTLTLTGNSTTNRLFVQSNGLGVLRTITAAAVSLTNVDFQDVGGAGAASPFTGTSLGDCLGNSGITFDTPVTQTRTGAGGNWSTSGNWTSRVPLPQDNVIIGAGASGAIGGDMPRGGNSVNWTGFTGTWANAISVVYFGNMTLGSGMTITNSTAVLQGRSAQTFTSNGKTLTHGLSIIAPGGTYTLQDAFVSNSVITVVNGAFDANNFNLTCLQFSSTTTGTITMGSGTWSLIATTAISIWNIVGSTIVAGTSTIIIANASANTRTFVGGGQTYNALTYTVANSPGALTITGANSFAALNVGSGRQLIMPSSTTTTITSGGSFNVNGVNNGYEYLPGVSGNYASAPDSAALSITTDITMDFKGALNIWNTGFQVLVAKYVTSGQYSYQMYMGPSGEINAQVYSNGSTATTFSSVATGLSPGATSWIRASITLNNGSNSACKFYTSTDGSVWTQLGTTITAATVASIFDNTSPVEVGSNTLGTGSPLTGKVYRARIFGSALGAGSGTPVFDADFTTKTFGANTFTESSSNAATVTINGTLAQTGDGRVSLVSSSGGVAATLSKSGANVADNFLVIQDSTATGGATWYAGGSSVNVSGNTGWLFSGPSSGGTGLLLHV